MKTTTGSKFTKNHIGLAATFQIRHFREIGELKARNIGISHAISKGGIIPLFGSIIPGGIKWMWQRSKPETIFLSATGEHFTSDDMMCLYWVVRTEV